MQRILEDEHLRDQDTPILSSSLEELGVQPNPNDKRPHTWVAARFRHTQTQAIILHSPKFEGGANNDNNSIQTTPSQMESEIESSDESEIEFSATHLVSPSSLDALPSRWCMEGLHTIYLEDVQRNE